MGKRKPGEGYGLTKSILTLLKEKPTRLYTKAEIAKEVNTDEAAVYSALLNAWRRGKIKRHIDRDEETGDFRHAIKIAENKTAEHIPRTTPLVRKSKKIDIKELKATFVVVFNSLLKIEENMLVLIEENERQEKAIAKAKKAFNQ